MFIISNYKLTLSAAQQVYSVPQACLLTHSSQWEFCTISSLSNIVSGGNLMPNVNAVFYFTEKRGSIIRKFPHNPINSIYQPTLICIHIFSSLSNYEEKYFISSSQTLHWASCRINGECPWSHCMTVGLSILSDQGLLITSQLSWNEDKLL